MNGPFMRNFETDKSTWVVGFEADEVALYLKASAIGAEAAKRALRANGCVKTATPDRPVSEAALVKRLAGAGVAVAGRLLNAEDAGEARRLGYLARA